MRKSIFSLQVNGNRFWLYNEGQAKGFWVQIDVGVDTDFDLNGGVDVDTATNVGVDVDVQFSSVQSLSRVQLFVTS